MPDGKVKIIPFTGTVDGNLFQGVVMPGAADVQITNPAGVRHMCAQYMLEGIDVTGNAAWSQSITVILSGITAQVRLRHGPLCGQTAQPCADICRGCISAQRDITQTRVLTLKFLIQRNPNKYPF